MAARWRRILTPAAPIACAAAAASFGIARCEPRRLPSELPELRKELDKLRPGEAEMRAQWIKDEEGWRKLPARAWPARQPAFDEIPALRAVLEARRCPPAGSKPMPKECLTAIFDLASALVFNKLGEESEREGYEAYRALGTAGDLDSIVATGVCLCEGLGTPTKDAEGVEWLERACALGSAQSQFELGMLHYLGQNGVEEDEPRALQFFGKAAAQNHSASLFMLADAYITGSGCAVNEAKAVPLLMAAAEQGHRGARQYVRQMLQDEWPECV